ncbi:hypothetical protein CI102_3441 [Trichoderma harzianum]|nr:hypothetical protein CI102_3441 [Trichoderma harzianum]
MTCIMGIFTWQGDSLAPMRSLSLATRDCVNWTFSPRFSPRFFPFLQPISSSHRPCSEPAPRQLIFSERLFGLLILWATTPPLILSASLTLRAPDSFKAICCLTLTVDYTSPCLAVCTLCHKVDAKHKASETERREQRSQRKENIRKKKRRIRRNSFFFLSFLFFFFFFFFSSL